MVDATLRAEIELANGTIIRLDADETDRAQVPVSIDFQTQIPGGFHTATITIPRPANEKVDNRFAYAAVTIYGAGDLIAYEGRIVAVPEVDANSVRLECEGHVAALSDNEAFRQIYVHQKQEDWQPASAQHSLDLAGGAYMTEPPQMTPDATTGEPCIELRCSGAWDVNAKPHPLATFSARMPIAEIYYAWKYNNLVDPANTNWIWNVMLGTSDRFTSYDGGTSLRATGPGSGRLVATSSARRFARIAFLHAIAGGVDNAAYSLFWTALGIYGVHDAPLVGTDTATLGKGVYGHDVIMDAVRSGAPGVEIDEELIEATTQIIYHLAYIDPTTVRQVIEDVTAFGGAGFQLNDWGVYENRKLFWRTPGTYGRTWKVRKDDVATPIGEGPSFGRRAAGVIVTYRDGGGIAKTVGPVGSGAETETDDLADTSVDNPVASLSKRIRAVDAGLTSLEGATFYGQVRLTEMNEQKWRGSVEVAGEIYDEAGNPYPPWLARGGDTLIVEDEVDRPLLPIAATSYKHGELSNTLDIGVEPHGAEALFAQYHAAAEMAGVA